MRKILYIFTIIVISFAFLMACRNDTLKSNKKIEQESSSNKQVDKLFSEKFFDNVVKIETGKVYPLQEIKNEVVIQDICNILKQLKLTQIDNLQIDGSDIMRFIYSDGTEKQFAFTSKYILYENVMYLIEDNQGSNIYDVIRTKDNSI